MAFENGVAASPTQLRDALQAFAVANGWTINRADDNGEPRLFLSEADQFVQLRFRLEEIEYAGALGFSAGADWTDQAGYCGWDGDCWRLAYPLIYYFFAGADYIHCALEPSAGLFLHLSFGRLVKAGAYAGGQYVVGVYWSESSVNIDSPTDSDHVTLWDNLSYNMQSIAGMAYADIPEYTNKWGVFSGTGSSYGGAGYRLEGSGRTGYTSFPLHDYGPNSFNNLQPLYPFNVFASRDDDSGFMSFLGHAPGARFVNLEGYAPGAELTIGPDTWQVFPMRQKQDPALRDNTPNSGHYGVAYLKTL